MPIKAIVITVSDSSFKGQREDLSGPAVEEALLSEGFELSNRTLVPDDKDQIVKAIKEAEAAGNKLIATTGGTGFGPRDITPEATVEACSRLAPGFGELMRSEGAKTNPRAILSRQQAGIIGKSLVINLPGSPRAAMECFNAVKASLGHCLEMLEGGGH